MVYPGPGRRLVFKVSQRSGQYRCIAVVGPTAGGKSSLAMRLAVSLGGEIVACDSVQVYRGFNIGSAKPTAEDRRRVPHHLLDMVDGHQEFDAATYAAAARTALTDVIQRGRMPIIVGGTGLYFRALAATDFDASLPTDPALRAELTALPTASLIAMLRDLDPVRSEKIHPNDRFRLARALEVARLTGSTMAELRQKQQAGMAENNQGLHIFTIFKNPPRQVLHERIAARAAEMLDAGLIEEVQALLAAGLSPACKPMQSIGYRQCVGFLKGELEKADLLPLIVNATRQYAKRQCTWFKKTVNHYLDATEHPDIVPILEKAGLR